MTTETLYTVLATLGVVGVAAGGFWAGWAIGHKSGQRTAVSKALAWKNPDAWELAHGILHEMSKEETRPIEKKKA